MGGQKTIGALFREAVTLMKGKYWQLVGSCAALTIVSAVLSVVTFVVMFIMNITLQALLMPISAALPLITTGWLPVTGSGNMSDLEAAGFSAALLSMLAVVAMMLLVVALLMIVYVVVFMAVAIVEQTVAVGVMEAVLRMLRGEKPVLGEAWASFRRHWKRYLGVSAWSNLWTMLWSLLFIVPGYIKGTSYLFAPYLVIQHPDMTVRQALKKSMEITNGYKGRLFLVMLIMLGFTAAAALIACCLFPALYAATLFWIYPLYYAMLTIAWLDIKQAAIEKGQLPGEAGCGPAESERA